LASLQEDGICVHFLSECLNYHQYYFIPQLQQTPWDKPEKESHLKLSLYLILSLISMYVQLDNSRSYIEFSAHGLHMASTRYITCPTNGL